MSSLKPVTLITGASAGIGEAFAHVFADHGHKLVLVARRVRELELVAGAIEAAGRPRPLVIAIDLTQKQATDSLARDILSHGLEPSIVVNNAGFGLRGLAAELDPGQQLEIIDLNARVLTDLSLRWIDSMQRHNGGLINISSVASFFPGPGMAVYYASKAYVLAFTEALHKELSPRGIKVTVVCPGPVATKFHARAGIAEARLPRLLVRSAQRVAREGYQAFMRGQRIVVIGTANKILAFIPRLLSRQLMLDLANNFQLRINPDRLRR